MTLNQTSHDMTSSILYDNNLDDVVEPFGGYADSFYIGGYNEQLGNPIEHILDRLVQGGLDYTTEMAGGNESDKTMQKHILDDLVQGGIDYIGQPNNTKEIKVFLGACDYFGCLSCGGTDEPSLIVDVTTPISQPLSEDKDCETDDENIIVKKEFAPLDSSQTNSMVVDIGKTADVSGVYNQNNIQIEHYSNVNGFIQEYLNKLGTKTLDL
jgi:hypothetical protein